MKKKIHPKYYKAKVTCSCGNAFEVGSTNKTIQTEICSKCHPFYTGSQKLVDTTGRVERFKTIMQKHQQNTDNKKRKKTPMKKVKKAKI